MPKCRLFGKNSRPTLLRSLIPLPGRLRRFKYGVSGASYYCRPGFFLQNSERMFTMAQRDVCILELGER